MPSNSFIEQEGRELYRIVCLFLYYSTSFIFIQPCQMLYQVCHEVVERFIQYGILLVAEVR